MYNYKQRNLSTLFDECAQFLDNMVEAYSSEKEDKGVNLSPQGCQSPIVIPLMLMKKVCSKVLLTFKTQKKNASENVVCCK